LPDSINETKPLPSISLIIVFCLILLEVFSNKSLVNVPLVARIPITFVFVCKDAGFIAGSMPINGTLYSFLKISIAFVVAVLQATTIILAPFSNNKSVFF